MIFLKMLSELNHMEKEANHGRGVEWALTSNNSGNARADRIAEHGGISEYAYKVLAAKERIENESIKLI